MISLDLSGGRKISVSPADIVAVVSADKYVYAVLNDGKKYFLSTCNHLNSLKKCSESVVFSNFLRVHKSTLVNMAKVSGIHSRDCSKRLDIQVGSVSFPVSRVNQSMVRRWWRSEAAA